MAPRTNDFLAPASSDDSDNESGYDSEAAEIVKSTKHASDERALKRRKFSLRSDSGSDSELPEEDTSESRTVRPSTEEENFQRKPATASINGLGSDRIDYTSQTPQAAKSQSRSTAAVTLPRIYNEPDLVDDARRSATRSKSKSATKSPTRPGVIYLSSLPPYLRPSALRNLLSQRGFEPITRLFLTPASASKSSTSKSKSNARQLYSEGWLEFASHKTAKKCAQTLNASPIGGKKGGYYRDDLWNMRYLRGMAWGELMAGVQGERREEEARRDEERRVIAREQRGFVEGGEGEEVGGDAEEKETRGGGEDGGEGEVERGADTKGGGEEEPRRTWRQFEVKNKMANGKGGAGGKDEVGEEAREVLAKIF